MVTASNNIIEIKDLCIKFKDLYGDILAVNNATINFKKGFISGIIGESGSGKSTIVYSIVNSLPKNGKITSGTIKFNGEELTNLTNKQLEIIKGNRICFIPQNPMSSLSPFFKIGNQMAEVIEKRNKLKSNHLDKKIEKEDIKKEIIESLKSVNINKPEEVVKKYPHELSGGMLQRIIISMALLAKPDLLIADEPTTALDVTVQLQILELIKNIQEKNKMSVIFITHDLGVIAKICDYVSVMYAGNIVETAPKNDIFNNPKHEYTKNLIKSMPKFNNEKFVPIKGNPINMSSNSLIIGCPFASRCDSCMEICLEKNIKRAKINNEHETSCFKYLLESFDKKIITKEYFENAINNVIENKKINYLDVVNLYREYERKLAEYKNKLTECIKFKKNKVAHDDEYKNRLVECKNKLIECKNKFYEYKKNKLELKILNKKENLFYEEKKFLFKINIKENIKEIKNFLNKANKNFFCDKQKLFDYLSSIKLNKNQFFIDFSKNFTKNDLLLIKNEYKLMMKNMIKCFFKFKNKEEKIINKYKFDEVKNKYNKIFFNYKINKKILKKTLKLQKYIVDLALLKMKKNKKEETIKEKELYDKFIKQKKLLKVVENDLSKNAEIIENEIAKLQKLYIDYLYEYYG